MTSVPKPRGFCLHFASGWNPNLSKRVEKTGGSSSFDPESGSCDVELPNTEAGRRFANLLLKRARQLNPRLPPAVRMLGLDPEFYSGHLDEVITQRGWTIEAVLSSFEYYLGREQFERHLRREVGFVYMNAGGALVECSRTEAFEKLLEGRRAFGLSEFRIVAEEEGD